MKNVRFTGQQATVFHGIGEMAPGEERQVVDSLAKALIGRGEFELVVPPRPVKRTAKIETDKAK